MNISVPYDTYFPSRHSSSVLYAETSVDRLFLSVESLQRENAHTSTIIVAFLLYLHGDGIIRTIGIIG